MVRTGKGIFYTNSFFSDNISDIDGEGWDSYPSSGNPEPPEGKFIKKTGQLTTTLKLDLVQESDSFAMWDAVDGIVAMSWENMEGYDEYPEKRLFFSFGEDIESVNDKLYEKDMVLNYNKELINT